MGDGIRPKGAGSAYCKGCRQRFTDDKLKPFNQAYCNTCMKVNKESWKKLDDIPEMIRLITINADDECINCKDQRQKHDRAGCKVCICKKFI